MNKKTMNRSLGVLGIRGKVGDVVFKKYRSGTVITKCPDMSQAGCSPPQRIQRNHFKQAVVQAKAMLANPERKRYFEKLPGKGSAWNKALAASLKEQKP
jgi:hypothetical protein